MIHVPFLPLYVILISVWVFYSFSRWRKKRFGFKRELLIQLLFVYLLMVIKFTFTPFYLNLIYPDRDMNLIPLVETLKMLKGARLTDALYNIVGNLLIMVPFSFLIAWLYPGMRKWRSIFFYSLGFSFIIEILQYASTTRIFDIDDIIFNTLSGLIGYAGFRVLHRLFSPVASKEASSSKPPFKAIVTASIILALTFFSVFAYTYENQTLTLSDINSSHASRESKELLMINKESYQYFLIKKGDTLTVELYGKLPFNRFISFASSDAIEMNKSSAALGDFNYQITYQKLNKTGAVYVTQKAPYVLFGYVPNTIASGEIYYNNALHEASFSQQYFISAFEADVPFEKQNQLIAVNIRDTEGKQWIPELSD